MTMESDQLAATTPSRHGYPVVAWVVILITVATVFCVQLVVRRGGEDRKQTASATFEMQARYLVGLAQLDSSQRSRGYEEAGALNTGPEGQRFRFVALAGELAGPDEALKHLHQMDTPYDDPRTAELLEKLYEDYRDKQLAAPSLTDDDRQELHDKLGWSGDLALNAEGSPDAAARTAVLYLAQKTLAVTIVLVCGFAAMGVVGLNLLIVMAVLLAQRKARLRFTTGSSNGGIYAETFALWMVLFVALGLLGSVLPSGQNHLLVSGLLALSSLSALAWPVIRGVPWATVRQEIGLVWKDRTTADRMAVLEPIFGVGSYAATLPLLFVGALLTFGLMRLEKAIFGEGGDPLGLGSNPSHPIAGFLVTTNWWGKLQVILAASVGAPIIEETMFRGVLHRHLREATGRWGRALSFLASAAAVSFIFAVIHPQGILAVPALMSLAIGFSMVREWRGTLVPSMVAHGLNNTLVTVFVLMSSS